MLPLLFGCNSLTSTQVQTSIAVMNATVPPAVAFAAYKDTNTIPYFKASAAVIDLIAKGTNDNPAILITELNKVPAVASSPYAKPAILAGVGIYTAFYGQTMAGNTNTIVLLSTFADDVRLGLGEVAAKKLVRLNSPKH